MATNDHAGANDGARAVSRRPGPHESGESFYAKDAEPAQRLTRSAASSRRSRCGAIELTASVGQARAALAAATADRNNVYAGVRAEQIASLKAEIAKAKSRLEYAEQQLSRTEYLARSETASQQALDQADNDVASARADVAEAQANYGREPVGPRLLPSTPVPEPYWSTPRPRSWIGIVMRFAGAAAVAAVIAALVVWKTPWNMNNGHLDQGPPVASGLSRPVESDDGDRTIVASRRPTPAAPNLAVGEESAPSRDTLAGAPMSQQREPSARVQEAIPPTAQTMAPGFVTRELERDEVVLLVKRGEDFITSGDLSSARLVLQRAAEAGDMHAALALAGTFDPNLLAKGFAADVVMARFWYERAKQFGSTEAPRRLEQLESSVKSDGDVEDSPPDAPV
jgi:hypothetical protein